MGYAVSLHPLAIVSMIAFGTLTFGIMGALLAVPIGGTVYSVAKYLTGRELPPRLQPPRPPRRPHLPKFLRRKHGETDATPTAA
jgi:predicted PurR-regulated permease PerM